MKRGFLLALAILTLSISSTFAKTDYTVYLCTGYGPAAATERSKGASDALCLQIAQAVVKNASSRNVTVVIVKSEADFRKAMADVAKSNSTTSYFVGLRLASSASQDDNGIVISMDPNSQIDGSKLLARHLMHSFSTFGPIKNERTTDALIAKSSAPAVVLMPGYSSSVNDMAKLKDAAYRDKIASTILSAVLMK